MLVKSTTSSVQILSLTGSSAVKGAGIDTAVANPMEAAMIHVRTEIASGSPDAATVAWKLQTSVDDVDGNYADAVDNTGTVIGATLTTKLVANDAYARIEGLNLYGGSASPHGGQKRWIRVVLTPAYTGGSSPATLTFAEIVGVPASGQQYPVRTTVSNT